MEDESLDEHAKIPEVEAFFDRFNYFRKPYHQWVGGHRPWKRRHGYAGDLIAFEALEGRGDIGLLLNLTPTFICFDIDTPGKVGEEEGREELPKNIEAEASPKPPDVGEEAGSGPIGLAAGLAEWEGWSALGIGHGDHGLAQAMASIPDMPVMAEPMRSAAGGGSIGPELRGAVRALCECFNEVPSLVRRSPHGCHVYWLLDKPQLWYGQKHQLAAVRQISLAALATRGIRKNIQVLPTPTEPLRIPRKDRLLDSLSLEPLEVPADGEAFWRSLRVYPLEGLIKEEVLEAGGKLAGRPRLRKPSVSASGMSALGAVEDGDMMSLHPRNRVEAEELLMPFREGMTNGQLIKLVEGGKREGLSLDDVTEWILGWETRSRAAGYKGDLFDDENELRGRIEALFERSTATAAGTTRFIKLWDRKKGDYGRDVELAERLLGQLEGKGPQPKQSRQAVLRFLADLDVWRRIVDEAVADPESGIDDLMIRNQARGAYPLPYELRRRMYSNQGRIWTQMETLGMVVKDDQSEGHYVPDLGRPQYYRLENIRNHGGMDQGESGA